MLPILQGQLAWGRHIFHFPKNELLKRATLWFWKLFYPSPPWNRKEKIWNLWGIWGLQKGTSEDTQVLCLVKKLTWTASYPQIQPCWFHSLEISPIPCPSLTIIHLQEDKSSEPAVVFLAPGVTSQVKNTSSRFLGRIIQPKWIQALWALKLSTMSSHLSGYCR